MDDEAPEHHHAAANVIMLVKGLLKNMEEDGLGIRDSVLVLTHRQSESERSYHKNWPFGGEIQFEPSTAQIDENQDLAA